jgi:ectoine hydroxylase
MKAEDILNFSPKILDQKKREEYFEKGFVTLERIIPVKWVTRLIECAGNLFDVSRSISQSNDAFDLGPNHNSEQPHIRRLKALVDRDPVFWDFASVSLMGDIAADLVGPDVKFHSSKLNYKWPGSGEVVKWHQDIPAWPHTNYSPVTLGVYLEDVSSAEGPLVCIPASHNGSLYFHTDFNGKWTGAIAEDDLSEIDQLSGEEMIGAAGTVVAINCRAIHSSAHNVSDRVRPVALFVYSSADAFAWMPSPTPTSKTGQIIRGSAARIAHLDDRPCPVPPNWDDEGYNSIFSAQSLDGK